MTDTRWNWKIDTEGVLTCPKCNGLKDACDLCLGSGKVHREDVFDPSPPTRKERGGSARGGRVKRR